MKNTNALAELHIIAVAIASSMAATVKHESSTHKKLSVLFREAGELCAESDTCPIETERTLNAMRLSKIAELKDSQAHAVAVANCHKAYNHAVKNYFCATYNQTQDDNGSDKAIYYYAVSKGYDACIWYAPQVGMVKPQKSKPQKAASGSATDSTASDMMHPNTPQTLLQMADDAGSFLSALAASLDNGMVSPADVLAVVANYQALQSSKDVLVKVRARSVPLKKEIALLSTVVVADKQEAATGSALAAVGVKAA